MSKPQKPTRQNIRESIIDWVKEWPNNSRFYIVAFNVVLSLLIWQTIKQHIESPSLQIIRTEQWFGFLAFTYLYLTLLVSPLTKVFTRLPFEAAFIHSRRALGVVAFYFAMLHGFINFNKQLGGINGLQFLSDRFLLAVVLGFVALTILMVMALTSFDWVIKWMGINKWRWVHSLIYPAGLIILLHMVMVGTHFTELNALIPKIIFASTAVLFILEAMRIDAKIQSKMPKWGHVGVATMLLLHLLLFGFGYVWGTVNPGQGRGGLNSLSVHSQHLKIAQDANNASDPNDSMDMGNSALGDKSLRYTVSFAHADSITPGQPTLLTFAVNNASSGSRIDNFQVIYEKAAHLVIVNDALTYYDHIHPEYNVDTGKLEVNAVFPKADRYHVYMNYQPLGAIEQQTGFTLAVGDAPVSEPIVATPDKDMTKTFGGYKVSLGTGTYDAQKISVGQQTLDFTIKDAQGKDFTDLRPYLAAFGHMVMINVATYDYIHVHPANTKSPQLHDTGGPKVSFMPLGLYGPIKPGTYRVFTQFNPSNNLLLTDFTVKVK